MSGGRVDTSETKLKNLAERKRRGGLQLNVLPATIRDAVSVVQGLGERFLWVNALLHCAERPGSEDELYQTNGYYLQQIILLQS